MTTDIPEDVRKIALECAETVLRNLPDDYGDASYEIDVIARAIWDTVLQERGRCARLIRNPNRAVLGIDDDALDFFTDSMARIILDGEYDALAVKREPPRSN